LVNDADFLPCFLQQLARPGAQQVAQGKGQQQLHGNAADGLQWVAGITAVGQQSAHQQRREHNAQQG